MLENPSLSYADVADRLYALVDLHETILNHVGHVPEPDEDQRRSLVGAIRHLSVYVCGADGQVQAEEQAAIAAIFWQDVDDIDLEFIRQYQIQNPRFIHTMLKMLEETIALHADVKTQLNRVLYTAEDDPIVFIVGLVCQTVLAADREMDSEAKRLGHITSRLREHAVGVERLIAERYGSDASYSRPQRTEPAKPANEAKGKSGAARIGDAGSIEDSLSELHKLVGLEGVKEEVETLANLAKVFAIRKERGMAVPDMSFHLVFLGNPGTGKTTVARIISQLYGQLGLLSSGHLVEVDRSGLVGNFVGQTATKVQEVVAKAMGGVLFIDEAYSLVAKGEGDYGREAIETLLKAMEDHRKNLIVIVAGYSHEMHEFLVSNPGLRSRFSRDLLFVDYTAEQMVEIFRRMAEKAHYTLDEGADSVLQSVLHQRWESRGPNFANARDVRNYFERAISQQANRLGRTGAFDESVLCILTADDLQRAA